VAEEVLVIPMERAVTGAAAVVWLQILHEGLSPFTEQIIDDMVAGRLSVIVYNLAPGVISDGRAPNAYHRFPRAFFEKWAKASSMDRVCARWMTRKGNPAVARVFLITGSGRTLLLNFDAKRGSWSLEPGSTEAEHAALN
jgi:hypothetical protein